MHMSELQKYIEYNNELLERMDIVIDYNKSIKEHISFRFDRLKEVKKPETNNNIEVLKNIQNIIKAQIENLEKI